MKYERYADNYENFTQNAKNNRRLFIARLLIHRFSFFL